MIFRQAVVFNLDFHTKQHVPPAFLLQPPAWKPERCVLTRFLPHHDRMFVMKYLYCVIKTEHHSRVLLLHIWDAPGSNLGAETGYTDMLLVFVLSTSRQIPGQYLALGQCCFFQYLFQIIIRCPSRSSVSEEYLMVLSMSVCLSRFSYGVRHPAWPGTLFRNSRSF
jgi:hypothetical protein